MEEAILRKGDLKKFEKYIRKRGVEAILDEETFQLILSNTIYADFDVMGVWIQEVLKAKLWHRVTRATAASLQAAPFRMVKFERLTPKRLAKTVEAIIQNHQEKKSLAIRFWLPWIILYTEEVDPQYPDKLDDVVFCLFFYEALDFAFRAKASAQTFRHMFHTDRLKTQVRARYLRFCTYCIEHHLAKCGKIQFLGDAVCEISPILLAYRLGLPRLAVSIMTFMDDAYLAHIRAAFLEQAKASPGVQVPTYFFEAHARVTADDPRCRDVPAHVFTAGDVKALYDQRELIVYLANTARELFDPLDLLDFHDVTRDVLAPSSAANREWVRDTFVAHEPALRAWLDARPDRAVDAVVDLADLLPPTLVSPALLARVFYEVPFLAKLLPFVRAPFHVHPPALPSYLFFCLDCVCRDDVPALRGFLSMTRTLPRGWRAATSVKPKAGEVPLLGSPYARHWARFFDREVAKLLKSGGMSLAAWGTLCAHGFPSLLAPHIAGRKQRTTWDQFILGLRPFPRRAAFLEAFWQRCPLGTYAYGLSGRRARAGQAGWTPLMWVVALTPPSATDAAEVWRLAERWCPNYLSGGDLSASDLSGGDLSGGDLNGTGEGVVEGNGVNQEYGRPPLTALHLARDKARANRPIREGALEWLREHLSSS